MPSEEHPVQASQFWHGFSVALPLGVGIAAAIGAVITVLDGSSTTWIYFTPWIVFGIAVAMVNLETLGGK